VKRKYKQCRSCQYGAVCLAGGPEGVHALFRNCLDCLGTFIFVPDGVGIEARMPNCSALRRRIPTYHRATRIYCPYCQADQIERSARAAEEMRHAK